MALTDNRVGHSEGYCPKCHQPLGIDGICYACAINDNAKFDNMIARTFTCPICGLPKTHHRLHGYRCDNPEHYEQEQAMIESEIAEALERLKGRK